MPQKPTSNKLGLLIMFDGPDEVGKSTQLDLAARSLRQQGYEVYTNRINGGTPIGEAIRRIYLDASLNRPRKTDLHLMLASYYALAEELLKQRRSTSKTIFLIDRSPLSMMAYHVYAGGLGAEGRIATEETLDLFAPDLLICYRAPLDVLQKRRQARLQQEQRGPDFVESQPASFRDQVLKGYEEAAKRYHAQVIDASDSPETVHLATMKAIKKLINSNYPG